MAGALRIVNLHATADGVFVSTQPFGTITAADLDQLENAALAAPRRRARICCHHSLNDSPQEMLISLKPGTYIRPHKHYAKAESALAIRGMADALFFDEAGQITDVWPIAPEGSGCRFFYRIAQPIFHCLLLRHSGFLFHEVATGPFRQDDTVYAAWSPREDDAEAVAQYTEDLRRRVDQFRGRE